MKKLLTLLTCLISLEMHALEYEPQFENEHISVSRVKVLPQEEIGLHRDAYPQVVIALKGGVITRLEADGREIDVEFPEKAIVLRETDPVDQLHKSVNRSDEAIELIVIQLKTGHLVSYAKKPR